MISRHASLYSSIPFDLYEEVLAEIKVVHVLDREARGL